MPAMAPSAIEKHMVCCVIIIDPLLSSQLTDRSMYGTLHKMNGDMLLKGGSSYLGPKRTRTKNAGSSASIQIWNIE